MLTPEQLRRLARTHLPSRVAGEVCVVDESGGEAEAGWDWHHDSTDRP